VRCISCDKKLTNKDKEDPMKEMCNDCYIYEMGITWDGMHDESDTEKERESK
jgi:hypothetical protein